MVEQKQKVKKVENKRNYFNCFSNYNHSIANPCGSEYCHANWTKRNTKSSTKRK